jgi:hypothetical protein
MPDVLAFKAVGYALIGFLALTVLILTVVSLRTEIISGKPLNSFVPVVIIIATLCAFIALFTAYLELQRANSLLLRWERVSIIGKE